MTGASSQDRLLGAEIGLLTIVGDGSLAEVLGPPLSEFFVRAALTGLDQSWRFGLVRAGRQTIPLMPYCEPSGFQFYPQLADRSALEPDNLVGALSAIIPNEISPLLADGLLVRQLLVLVLSAEVWPGTPAPVGLSALTPNFDFVVVAPHGSSEPSGGTLFDEEWFKFAGIQDGYGAVIDILSSYLTLRLIDPRSPSRFSDVLSIHRRNNGAE